ncbi:mechanosensitive ion channel family protein [Pseudohongiella sp.]|uniref:Mechanosensitive ion channel MscS domain-containing protein n=1 Tax=marine sediment metagenome TaxID=412755 RepID=A0A0F9WHX1_9ZZZZ|nr:mechanosensitive ion channel family protein [Pseudohongiella sp.]HDZ07758.1 mechanosensitive ion channel family protein [Pseudohongiella sp.]HEA62925.1 mechanosensitive ion channel family protein [Pseudohongiella sp.]
MPEFLTQLLPDQITVWLETYEWLAVALAVVSLLATAWLFNLVTKRVLVRGVFSLLEGAQQTDENGKRLKRDKSVYYRFGFIRRLANVIPVLVITFGIRLIPDLPDEAVVIVTNVGNAFIVLTIALALGSIMDLINDLYQRRPEALDRPIKGYLQVLKIVLYAVAVLLMIATLLDRSPVILLSGVGALAAVLMLVFQDTLLSLVASVQITSNDMVRVGDWIEMPELSADGDVIDIALHIVKVQNWDKTITTIPTRRFISGSFKNWRGMRETGGRRIKRAVYLDQNSVHFLSTEEVERLGRFSLLQDYLKEKQEELDDWNTKLEERGKEPVNTRRMTNLGTFRAYMVNYLRASERVRQDLTLIVRHQGPGPDGLPIEIYCFTNTVNWVEYEGIQSDIFDHLLAILPEFGLQVFQQPSGRDMRAFAEGRSLSDNANDDARSLKDTPEGEPGDESGQRENESSGNQSTKQEETR